MWILIIANHST